MTTAYRPSPNVQVREQVALYEATCGREGNTLDGRPVVILTTTGVKTGSVRKNPIMRIKSGDTYIAVASNGGAGTNPSWYHNLIAQPEVLLQDGDIIARLWAREVCGEEKTKWWGVADRAWPHFAVFRSAAGHREIPVIVLETGAPT